MRIPKCSSRPRGVSPRGALGACVALLAALAAGCRSEPPNVIFYVVDTLRADAVGPYGNTVVETPALDRLAREGVVFENAYVPSSWTRPSIASLLTGIAPDRHGVETRADGLTDGAHLLAEQMREHGYATGAIVTNPNAGSFFGFDQGYDDFIELYDRRQAGYVDARELVADSRTVTELAIEWIDRATPPFFLFILTTDPHWPYLPPEGFDRYGGSYRGEITGRDFRVRRDGLSEADIDRMRSLYYGEIAFLDSSFGVLLEHLRDADLYDRTVVAFTSDHGEEFWERGIWGHGGNLSEIAIRVPLILRGPGAGGPGTRISRVVRAVDLYPTLLELAGLPVPAHLDGRSLFDEGAERALHTSLDLDGTRLKGVTVFPWKLILDEGRERRSLVNLAADPGEEANLLEQHPEEASRLAALLAERARAGREDRDRLARAMFGTAGSQPALPQDVKDALEALGYATGPEESAATSSPVGEGGLLGRYYANAEWRGAPQLRRVDPRIDFDWLEPPWPLPPPFSIEWTGSLRIEKAGLYGFWLESDDGSVLEIDERVVVDNGGTHAIRTRSGSVQLSEGVHAVRIRYFNEFLGGRMRVVWRPPGGAVAGIPSELLSPDAEKGSSRP